MNAVYAMQELALGTFTDYVRPLTYALPDYPSVSVVTEATTTSDTIERRFLIWGIWKGIFYMMEHDRFQNALFTLYWDGLVVGYVIFAKSRAQQGLQISNITNELSQKLQEGFPARTSNGTLSKNSTKPNLTVVPDNVQLEVDLALSGQALTINELFITVLSGLAYVAESPDKQEMEDFSLSPATYNVTLSISGTPNKISSNTPVLEARWVIATLGLIPGYMLDRSDFREMVMEMRIDGQVIGQGFIEMGKNTES